MLAAHFKRSIRGRRYDGDGRKNLSSQPDMPLFIGEKRLSEVRLWRDSKIGNRSWKGCMDNRPVKIYQTFSPVHAEYVEQVSQDSVLCQYFPQVMRRWNEYLVVEWIAGKSLNAEKVVKNRALLQEMVGLQAAIHSRTFPGTSGSFSYLSYLHDRLLRYIGPFVQSDGICQIIDLIQNHAPGQLDACVSHPDVTPNNLVIEETSGRLKLVDNEALTQSWYYLIDLFNTKS